MFHTSKKPVVPIFSSLVFKVPGKGCMRCIPSPKTQHVTEKKLYPRWCFHISCWCLTTGLAPGKPEITRCNVFFRENSSLFLCFFCLCSSVLLLLHFCLLLVTLDPLTLYCTNENRQQVKKQRLGLGWAGLGWAGQPLGHQMLLDCAAHQS